MRDDGIDQRFHNEPVHRFTTTAECQCFEDAIATVLADLGQAYPLRIAGRIMTTRDTISSNDPACPERVVGIVAAASPEDLDAAVAAATDALPTWAGLAVDERTDRLRRAASLLRERRDVFAAWEIVEAGKPWAEADADICEAIDHLEYHALQAGRVCRELCLDVAGESNRYGFGPRGVTAVLPPWNFPVAIPAGMIAAALVTGNPVIVKPSSLTPVVATLLVDLLHEAGIPPAIVQCLPGAGAVIGEGLVRHAGIATIAFTGSTAVGLRIHRLGIDVATEQARIKQVITEMGGKNAIIVDDDADLDDAVAGIVASAFGYAGQKCSACSRVITVGSIHDRLVERLAAATRSLVVGDPKRPETFIGPVISAEARARLLATIDAARQRLTVACVVTAPSRDGGHYVGPAIFSDVPPDDVLTRDELFGPVLAVLRARDFEHALALANDSRYALTGGVYSRSPAHLERATSAFAVGNLYLNRGITGAIVGRQPFGGHRLSGHGLKTGGPDTLLEYMQARTVTENRLRRGFAPEDDGHRA